ncbi:HPP family protein [Halobaculum sp. P14]|uniref:HPP family protein n=1 Tax=Halobaculum sp. P14 TaxID=3421638 RepID=UPI003EB76DDF
MFDRLVDALTDAARRLRRVERRELAAFARWVENTDNLVHLSVLLFVPLLIAVVTELSNVVQRFSFLLFPPLASGTYTLFANPEGEYSEPVRFVAGLTAGAACGWAALRIEALLFDGGGEVLVTPTAAAFSILLAGVVTWGFGVEEPSAFSSALLVLAAPERPALYVGFIFAGSVIVAAAFAVWRRQFYQQRAELLYGTMRADDHVLVPVRGDDPRRTALFGARLAAAHEAGKVVLLDVVSDERVAEAEHSALGSPTPIAPDDGGFSDIDDPEVESAAVEAAERLDRLASTIRTRVGIPCETVVTSGDPLQSVRETVTATNCDLVVTQYEEDRGLLSEFVRSVFRFPVDAVAFRPSTDRERWRRVLVPVARPGDSAHAMVDFATRLAGRSGSVSVCTCIDREVERRRAEERLADVVETVDGPVETRVARSDVLQFIEANADAYDLVMLGSSRDRSPASRVLSPPTFEKVRDLDCDVAVVDRADVGRFGRDRIGGN